MSIDYTTGSLKLKDDTTLPYIWVSLHVNAKTEWDTLSNPRLLRETKRITDEVNYLLEALRQVSEENWSSLCTVAGWTVYGAVALSWCKDAEISQVWDGWEASGFPLKPLPEFERPARFINPALMPQTNTLTGILEAFNNRYPDSPNTYSLAICAAIAASKEPLVFDMSADPMRKATPQIASFLKSRMLQKADRTAEENTLIEVWTETIKDTEFDVWEEV